jgi:hypothetical protein
MSIRTSVEFVPELRVDWEAGIYHPVTTLYWCGTSGI